MPARWGRLSAPVAAAALVIMASAVQAQSNPTVPPLRGSLVPPLSGSPVPPLRGGEVPTSTPFPGDIVNPGALAFFHAHRHQFSGFRLREVFVNGERKHLVILERGRRGPMAGKGRGADRFGIVALSLPQGGTLFSIMTGAEERDCEPRNQAYIDSFLSNCPGCRLSFSDCGAFLPEEFTPTLENRPIGSPYVAWDAIDAGSGDTGSGDSGPGRRSVIKNRMIFLGMPPDLADQLCRRTMERLKARCIMPPRS